LAIQIYRFRWRTEGNDFARPPTRRAIAARMSEAGGERSIVNAAPSEIAATSVPDMYWS
jgi:hypothetical protein